jgi:hypothetical protein
VLSLEKYAFTTPAGLSTVWQWEQGDQVGRIFAYWAVATLGSFLTLQK